MEGEGYENPLPNANTLGGGMGTEGELKEPRARTGGEKEASWEGCVRAWDGEGEGALGVQTRPEGNMQDAHKGCVIGGRGRKGKVLAC